MRQTRHMKLPCVEGQSPEASWCWETLLLLTFTFLNNMLLLKYWIWLVDAFLMFSINTIKYGMCHGYTQYYDCVTV